MKEKMLEILKNNQDIILNVSEGVTFKRVDSYIINSNIKISRKELLYLFKQKLVNVNGVPAVKSELIKYGDIITLPDLDFAKANNINSIKQNLKTIPILYNNNGIVIVEKPGGIPTLSKRTNSILSVQDLLITMFPELVKVEEAGLIQRLDNETSGLLLVGLNNKIRNYLKSELKNLKILKYYMAIIHGVGEPDGIIDHSIVKANQNGSKMKIYDEILGKKQKYKPRKALTIFKTEKKAKDYTLIDIEIKTGVRHQIRVHLSAKGFVIVGDSLYGFKKETTCLKDVDPLPLCLHAKKLALTDMDGNKIMVKSDLPDGLKKILELTVL